MNIPEIIQDDLQEIECDFGRPTFTWNGEQYLCLPDTLDIQSNTVKIGFEEKQDIKLTVRLNQFTDGIFPKANDLIIYNGKKMKIYSIQEPGIPATWILLCKVLGVGYAK